MVKRVRLLFPICALALAARPGFSFEKLSSKTAAAFDRYVESAESRMNRDQQPGRFLRADSTPELKAKLRGGELRIESGRVADDADEVPGGMLQDWVGLMFIPNATIQQVKTILQDYDNYKNFYKPEVIESKPIAHQGDDYDIFLRLYEKHVLTVVLNASYHVHYGMPDARRMVVNSHSTRIAEVKDAKRSYTEEHPVGDDTGFLWRLNSYWRFEEADGGVYAECEAISLSRDVPLGLGWMLKGFLERFPKESMLNTLRGTRAAVAKLAQTAELDQSCFGGGLRLRKNVTICHLCASGRCANEGMPLRSDPFSSTQNNAPGGASQTSARLSGGAFSDPPAEAP